MEHISQGLEKPLQMSDPYRQAVHFLDIVKHELEICDSYLSQEESSYHILCMT